MDWIEYYTYANQKWFFFTTNYDGAIEEYWVKLRKTFRVRLGILNTILEI